ncbi:MAG: Pseudouridine synthase [Candidatus Taylorbacteria bacterium]|nr:Pseudouridine synthase [Candidatus Taylorbacteria bacterium]
MRINKYLAFIEISTRRGADDLIRAGKIWINDRQAVLGDKVDEGDQVEVRFHKRRAAEKSAETSPEKAPQPEQKPHAKPSQKPEEPAK